MENKSGVGMQEWLNTTRSRLEKRFNNDLGEDTEAGVRLLNFARRKFQRERLVEAARQGGR